LPAATPTQFIFLMPRRPKLGQHFLDNVQYQGRIIESLDLRKQDLAVEVGPGRGAMTRLLTKHARRVVAIEIDALLAAQLQKEFLPESGVEVLQGDILGTDLRELCRQRNFEYCFVFGNLPYYITSPTIHHLFRFHGVVRAMALVMQREVAERVTATSGSRNYGYLSVLSQLYSRPRIALKLPPGAFSPPPKVYSALVSFEITPRPYDASVQWKDSARKAPSLEDDREKFLAFVKLCFLHKRKSVLNNLGRRYSRESIEHALAQMGVSGTTRAEQLSLHEFRDLYSLLASM